MIEERQTTDRPEQLRSWSVLCGGLVFGGAVLWAAADFYLPPADPESTEVWPQPIGLQILNGFILFAVGAIALGLLRCRLWAVSAANKVLSLVVLLQLVAVIWHGAEGMVHFPAAIGLTVTVPLLLAYRKLLGRPRGTD